MSKIGEVHLKGYRDIKLTGHIIWKTVRLVEYIWKEERLTGFTEREMRLQKLYSPRVAHIGCPNG